MKANIKPIILISFYSISLIVGLILSAYSDSNIKLLGFALIMNFANGLLCFSFFKQLKIKIFFKIALFLISVAIMSLIYVYYSSITTENIFYTVLPVLVNIIGICVLGIARLVLCKPNRYFILNFAIFPLSLLFAGIMGGFEIILMAFMLVILVVIAVSLIWFGGDPKLQYYDQGRIDVRYTTNGHTMKLCHDNIYYDENNGKKYALRTDGIFEEVN